jgi:NTE family protein
LFFTPFELDGVKLLDGGILNPVPIAPTFEDGTDMTIAINLGAPPTVKSKHTQKPTPTEVADSPDDSVHTKINNFIDGLKNRVSPDNAGGWTMLGIADQTFDAMQSAIARQKLAAYPPDHTVLIARDACGTLEFERADEMISLGYEAMANSLAQP